MALKVNKNGIIRPITTEITAFISNIDLIEENMTFERNTQYVLTLDYDYNFILVIHHHDPTALTSYSKIGSQLISIDSLKENNGNAITLSGVITTSSTMGYKVTLDSTGRIITFDNANTNVVSSLTILGIR
ncbi:MAG: hypothetical protein J6Y02_24180 [Pseudobutyrivibrio sp.]|nr:hypothetical protein [Pseudobutyrivibrio sp.]